MLKELWYWFFEFVKSLFSFSWITIQYRFINLVQYIIHGYTYSDLQDLDMYFIHKFAKMLPEFKRVRIHSCPAQLTEEKWEEVLNDMISCARAIDEGVLSIKEHEKARKRFLILIRKYFFYLWV